MEEGELEEIRKRKQEEKRKELEGKEVEKKLKEALRSALTEKAYDRMTNVAVANQELYLLATQQIMYAYKRLKRRIDEDELLSVLQAIKEQTEKKTSIRFHKK